MPCLSGVSVMIIEALEQVLHLRGFSVVMIVVTHGWSEMSFSEFALNEKLQSEFLAVVLQEPWQLLCPWESSSEDGALLLSHGACVYFLVGVPQRKDSDPQDDWEVLVLESEAKMPECSFRPRPQIRRVSCSNRHSLCPCPE